MVQQTVAIIPQVDQTFGGTFSPDTPPPSREDPACEARDLPWVGQRHPGRRRCPADRRGHRWQRRRPASRRPSRAPSRWAASRWAPSRLRRRRRSRLTQTVTAATRSPEGVTPFVQLRDVVVAFGGLLALGGVDLDVARGERLAVLGPNGAGKTTLFNVIAGDLHPTGGTVTINGVDCTTRCRRDAGRGSASPAPTRRPGCSPASPSRTTCSWPGSASTAGHRSLGRRGLRGAGRDAARAGRRGGVARRPARHRRRRPVPRPATPARGRHGRRHRARADDARRAGVGPVPGRARAPHRAAASPSAPTRRCCSSSTTWTSPCASPSGSS